MKNYIILYILVISLSSLLSQSIHAATEEKEKPRLLVVPLKAKKGIDQDEADMLTDLLAIEIHKSGRFIILNREDMKAMLTEKEFEVAMGCDDNVCLLNNVKGLSVNKIIAGSIGTLGKKYIISIRLINEDGHNERMEKHICECSLEELDKSIERLSYKFLEYKGEEPQNKYGSTKIDSNPDKEEKIFANLEQEKPYTFKDSITRMEFVFVKKGSFDMGDTFGDGDADENPVHEVYVDDFYIGKYEVTVEEFGRFVSATGYRTDAESKGHGFIMNSSGNGIGQHYGANWQSPGIYQNGKHPVVHISRQDAMAFIEWLKQKTGKMYRLPTEAEWEYAARGGGKRYKHSWGNGIPEGNIAGMEIQERYPKGSWSVWNGYKDRYVHTSPVGRFRANDLGIYDMTGNVWEWCSDRYSKDYYKNSPLNNPKGPSFGSCFLIRGGSWHSDPKSVRASYRVGVTSDVSDDNLGFRLAMTP
jgi:formylglycine-generating enzyme required for sulfatase activity